MKQVAEVWKKLVVTSVQKDTADFRVSVSSNINAAKLSEQRTFSVMFSKDE